MISIFCGAAYTLWFERTKFLTWEAAFKAIKAGYIIWVRTKDAFQIANTLSQTDNGPVASYIAHFECKLGNGDIKADKDLVIDALTKGIIPFF